MRTIQRDGKLYALLYRPESPVYINGRRIYPDFEFIHEPTRKKKWWDHFGKMHDPEYGVTCPTPTIIIVGVGASCSRQAALPDLAS